MSSNLFKAYIFQTCVLKPTPNHMSPKYRHTCSYIVVLGFRHVNLIGNLFLGLHGWKVCSYAINPLCPGSLPFICPWICVWSSINPLNISIYVTTSPSLTTMSHLCKQLRISLATLVEKIPRTIYIEILMCLISFLTQASLSWGVFFVVSFA